MNMGVLIPGLIFVLFTLVGLLALSYSSGYKTRKGIWERIRKETEPGYKEGLKDRKWPSLFKRMLRRLGETLRPNNEAEASRVRIKLLRGGYHGENAPLLFFGSKGLTAIVLCALFLILKLAIANTLSARHFLTLLVVSAAAGFYLPDLYLRQRTATRKRKIFEGFPDALDLMVVCVEAGMGLDAAIKRVGDEMALRNKCLSEEFRILSLELRAGKTRPDALRNLAMRTDLEDVSSLVTLLIQTDRFGTAVARALRVHSDAMRTKRYQRAEEIAAKLPVKIVFPLVFFIFPAVFVTIVGPAAISIYRNLIHR